MSEHTKEETMLVSRVRVSIAGEEAPFAASALGATLVTGSVAVYYLTKRHS